MVLPLPGGSSRSSLIISLVEKIDYPWRFPYPRTTQSGEPLPGMHGYWEPEDEITGEDLQYNEFEDLQHNEFESESKKEVGDTAFAFVYGGGVIVCSNHSVSSKNEPGSMDSGQNVIVLNSSLIAAISGEDVAVCKSLLKILYWKCQDHERLTKKRITVAEASQLMVKVMFSRSEVCLIAGWDDEMGAGDLYHVDGEKAQQASKMHPVAIGYGAQGVNSTMLCIKLDGSYHYEMSLAEAAEVAKQAICYGLSSCDEKEDFASVYHVGPEGWKVVNGEIDIEKACQGYGIPLPPPRKQGEPSRKMIGKLRRKFGLV